MRRGEVSIEQTARRLGVTAANVHMMIVRGQLKSRKDGHRRYVLVSSVEERVARIQKPLVDLRRARERLRNQLLADYRAGREAVADDIAWRGILNSSFTIAAEAP